MFFKFLYKYGPGSPGTTAKTIIEQHQNIRRNRPDLDTSEIFGVIINSRKMVSSQNWDNYYSKLKDLDTILEFINNDISLLVFLCLFTESKTFRQGVDMDSTFKDVTDVIYDISKKYSNLCKLSISDFRKKANDIMAFKIYNY